MKKKSRPQRSRCPRCGKYDNVGDNGYGRFFCSECYIQFRCIDDKNTGEKIVQIFSSDEEGKEVLTEEIPYYELIISELNESDQ